MGKLRNKRRHLVEKYSLRMRMDETEATEGGHGVSMGRGEQVHSLEKGEQDENSVWG